MKNTEEKLNRRLNLIIWMDDFIDREIEDPDLRKHWEIEGFRENMEEEDIVAMAEDEDTWVNIVDTFAQILDEHWIEGDDEDEDEDE